MNIHQTFFDEDLRVEQIIWLAANLDIPCAALREMIRSDEDQRFHVLTGVPMECLGDEDEDPEWDEVTTTLARSKKTGFLVRASTPVPQFIQGDGVSHLSWGWRRDEWFYTEALDEAFVQALIKWKGSVHEKAKADAAKKKGQP